MKHYSSIRSAYIQMLPMSMATVNYICHSAVCWWRFDSDSTAADFNCHITSWSVTSFRISTEIWLQFSRLFRDKITSFFQTFRGTLFIFMWTKTLQNWLVNAEISYTMYSSIPNTEWDSNFWTLNFRCFESWTARKLTNALVISVTDVCIFQVNITVF